MYFANHKTDAIHVYSQYIFFRFGYATFWTRNVASQLVLSKDECLFMPPPLGAGGIMFSGCPSVRPPSVRPKPEIPSFDLYIGPLVHPTNSNRFTACLSVRPSVRPSVCPSVRLSVRPSGEVSGHLPKNAWREWPEILYADVS